MLYPNLNINKEKDLLQIKLQQLLYKCTHVKWLFNMCVFCKSRCNLIYSKSLLYK